MKKSFSYEYGYLFTVEQARANRRILLIFLLLNKSEISIATDADRFSPNLISINQHNIPKQDGLKLADFLNKINLGSSNTAG
jgi:hypothetical protein